MHLVTFERSTDHTPSDGSGSLGDAAMGFESLEPVRPGSHRLGAVVPIGPYAGWLVDLNRSLAIKLAYDDVGAPEVEANSMVPSDSVPRRCKPQRWRSTSQSKHSIVTTHRTSCEPARSSPPTA